MAGRLRRPEAWREVVLTAVPKKSDKVGFRAMRYISLFPVLLKFYIRALQTAVRRERNRMKQASRAMSVGDPQQVSRQR